MRSAQFLTWAAGLLLAGSGFLTAAGPTHENLVRKELDRLAGTWKVVSMVIDGKPQPLEDDDQPSATVKGSTMTTARGVTSVIALEPPKTVPGPGEVQIIITSGPVKGKVLKGVYQLTDELFTVAFADQETTAETMFKRHDRNGDGLLNVDEMPERLRLELVRWDSNGDGFIDLQEFRAYFRSAMQQALRDLTSRPGSGVTVMIYRRQPGVADEPPAGGRHGSPPRWEYRTLTRQQLLDLGKKDVTAGLNRMGDSGWELVAVQRGESTGPAEYYFKRLAAQTTSVAEPATGDFEVIPLKHAKAREAAKMLDELMNGNAVPRRARIVADENSNQLLISARPDDLLVIKKVLIDIDMSTGKK
jgi:uncharacterized protein (TIGR03067 family)